MDLSARMKLLEFLLFNRFTNSYLRQTPRFLFLNKRIGIVYLEFMNLISIIFLPILLLFIPGIFLKASEGANQEISGVFFGLLMSLLSLTILNKDFWGGQSIVNRLYGYKVVQAKNELPAGKIRCFIRNLTFVCWPIEIIPLLVFPKRRIGDLIAGTKLVETEKSDPKKILDEIAQTKWDRQTQGVFILNLVFITLNILYFNYWSK